MWERIYESDKEEWLEVNMPNGVVEPAFYNMLFTMHATIMVFFVVVPILVGTFGNFLNPLDDWNARHGVSYPQYALLLVGGPGSNYQW